MTNAPAPLERFALFREKLGLTDADIAVLGPHRSTFLDRSRDFVEGMYEFLASMDDTRRILEIMEPKGGLRKNWRAWYERLFEEGFERGFQEFLWSSGVKHVNRNVDQRFINLAYCRARLFLGRIAEEDLPAEEARAVGTALNKMLDFCLMVATDAFLATTTQCDREVINGIAHQVRNPLMVIGGFIQSLQRRESVDGKARAILGTMHEEARRLESMVEDVAAYIEVDQRDAEFGPCSIAEVLRAALERLRREGRSEGLRVLADLSADPSRFESDRPMLEAMFHQLLSNALEAAQEADEPQIRISTRVSDTSNPVLIIEIFNNGRIPSEKELEHLFTPFYSSKTAGTGFGLPIAALVAKKTQGEIEVRPVPKEGTLTVVTLPLPPH